MKETIEACKVLVDKYKTDEIFHKSVIDTIASAINEMPVGSIEAQAEFIADRFFGYK